METFEEILPGTWLLKVPFGIVWTGVILVRGEKSFLIDSSQEQPEEHLVPALDALGVGLSEIDWLLNTHSHGDHIGGHHALVTKYGLRCAALDTSADALRDPVKVAIRVRTRFPKNSPPPQSYLKGVEPAKVLAEDELLEGRFSAIRSPGHDDDCVCWYDRLTKTAFTGDSLQANGTPTQGVGFYRDLPAYRRTLAHLREYDTRRWTIARRACACTGRRFAGTSRRELRSKRSLRRSLYASSTRPGADAPHRSSLRCTRFPST